MRLSSRTAMARSGSALIEVIVAIVVLGLCATALLDVTTQSIATVELARKADIRLFEASSFLNHVVLWSRTELAQRAGQRRQGPWWLTVTQPTPDLFVLVLSDTLTAQPILSTVVKREIEHQ